MSKQQSDYFVNTYARAMLTDWRPLAKVMQQHTELLIESTHKESENDAAQPQIINRRQFDDAIHGPLASFFRHIISAYALVGRFQLEFNIKDNDVFKGKRINLDELPKIPETVMLNVTIGQIDEMRRELDQMTDQFYQQWMELQDAWKNAITQALEEQNITLAVLEITELQGREPMSELLDRFTDLKIDLPKFDKEKMSWQTYLQLKTIVVIHSALSRNQLQHDTQAINKTLKQIKSVFADIDRQEKQLNQEQQATIDQLMTPIKF